MSNPLQRVATNLTQFQKAQLASNYHNIPYQKRTHGPLRVLGQEVEAIGQNTDLENCLHKCDDMYTGRHASFEHESCRRQCKQ
jgi:hypothetical protein